MGIAGLVLAADVVTKVLAVARLEDRDPVELLGGAVYLVLVRNPGAAFSLATGYTWVLTLVATGPAAPVGGRAGVERGAMGPRSSSCTTA